MPDGICTGMKVEKHQIGSHHKAGSIQISFPSSMKKMRASRTMTNTGKKGICSVQKEYRGDYPIGAPGIPAGFFCWVIIMSSTRMSIAAVSDALWMDCRLDRRGSKTPSVYMSMMSPE
jgi:L,D-peptidoglycan transpeptidase YkuD (ErfK/YbiS/YcfS/YnhG family)